MATKFRFPPSARDFALQRAISFEGLSTWQAAARFGISQPRVRQILQRVADWTAEALPPQMEAEAAARLRYAEHLAADRLEHHYQETMEQWRATHQTRFLMQAMRVALAAGKLPAPSGVIEALAADAIEGPEAEEGDRGQGTGDRGQKTEDSYVIETPPEEDFSARGDLGDGQAVAGGSERDVSSRRHEFLDLLRSGPAGATAVLSERTRSLLSPVGSERIMQVRISPQQPGASIELTSAPPERPLSRQERRRLQKKLKRAKGLAR
jgi:hypothetical protein